MTSIVSSTGSLAKVGSSPSPTIRGGYTRPPRRLPAHCTPRRPHGGPNRARLRAPAPSRAAAGVAGVASPARLAALAGQPAEQRRGIAGVA